MSVRVDIGYGSISKPATATMPVEETKTKGSKLRYQELPRRKIPARLWSATSITGIVVVGLVLVAGLVVLFSTHATESTSIASLAATLSDRKPITPVLRGKLPIFSNAATVGHLKPDVDSVAGAIAAAHLFHATPTAPGAINRESAYALKLFNVPEPKQTDDPSLTNAHWILIDHGSKKQNFLNDERVVALIDHHSMAEDEVDINHPIYVDIRPWGSINTVLAFMYSDYGLPLPPPIAGIMLSAIISDTLNLRSPTTTDYDREAWRVLSDVIGFNKQQTNELARSLFQAKSDVTGLTPTQVLLLDFKSYVEGPTTFGWGSGETTTPENYLSSAMFPQYLSSLAKTKIEKNLDFMFFSVTDIDPDLARPRSIVFLGGEAEKMLATAAFPSAKPYQNNPHLLDVGALMSRKKDFIPALKKGLALVLASKLALANSS